MVSHSVYFATLAQNLAQFSFDLATIGDRSRLIDLIDKHLRRFFSFEYCMLLVWQDDHPVPTWLLSSDGHDLPNPSLAQVKTFAQYRDHCFQTLRLTGEVVVFDIERLLQDFPSDWLQAEYYNGIREKIGIGLRNDTGMLGVLYINTKDRNRYPQRALDILRILSSQLSTVIAYLLAKDEIAGYGQNQPPKEEEKIYFREELGIPVTDAGIIGESIPIKKVFRLIRQVAPSDSTVLLLGETGTGKELIARAIHDQSARKNRPMIKVNCAALPANLIESELFGHERGSFTGAIEKRIGKFEQANQSTLFLDEIGEMPLELQVKLLRVLQEKEIERVGGRQVIRTDVRIIAATNRDLGKEMAEGRFRSDLYYRLDIFPIHLPALRERKEDIPLLAAYFIDLYSKKTGRRIEALGSNVLQDLMSYHWPGNIRELEHLLERCILQADGDTIRQIDLPKSPPAPDDHPAAIGPAELKTLEENEREYILTVTRHCKGRIAGPAGAAELLGVHPSTLNSRMKKLGIKKEHIHHS